MRRFHMNTCAALGAAVLLLGLSGCGGGNPKSDPSQSPTLSTSPSNSPTPQPTWDNKFTPAQMKRYQAARAIWQEFWAFYTEAARKGIDTPAVQAGFAKYVTDPITEHQNFLDIYVTGGVRMEKPPTVLWTSASKITKTDVVFNYCLDMSTDHEVNETTGQVNPIKPPLKRLVTVQMHNTTQGWKQQGFLNQYKEQACDPTAP